MRKPLLVLLLASISLWSTACGDDNEDKDPCDTAGDFDVACADPDAGTPPPDAGGTDAGTDAGTDGGLVIVAAPEVWTWVDIQGTACGNGAQTGIGVNPTDASTDLYLYMQGGGACWDEQTCFIWATASNLSTGYQAAQFQTESSRNLYMFNRAQDANPFRDMSYVFVPYCTGDVHAGDAVQTYGSRQVHHKGAANVEALLPRLVATFPNTQRVFLAGSSAGAFGAQLNYEQVAAAFPTARVHVLADSGQMLTPAGNLYSTWVASWGLTLPEACPDCDTDFTRFPAYLTDTYPDSRFGLLAWDQDTVLRTFFGYNATTYETLTRQLLVSAYDGRANARYFLKNGAQHTFLSGLGTITSTTGVTLNAWVSGWVSGDASWSNALEP
ncbi:pectinacetylesterase family protein [Pyxidicoccus xibeiensis]|uniref:pectinacetylesterase family protein n=1 Tax=Pyxidicoccus xibeiensis TaxID=2906759 RepID=UPI0020A7E339|nr:pectinacetylesterase family protein [Pyxidicoccus xibeiensis]MCP3139237.1 pectinacetylesterase family protein [Pyxidicoccus xibeiensis]